MHSEIVITQARVFELYKQQHAYLAGKPKAVLEELHHRADELRNAEDFTVRTAAEINRTACVFLLGLDDLPPGGGKR